jgi:hypothetical protein
MVTDRLLSWGHAALSWATATVGVARIQDATRGAGDDHLAGGDQDNIRSGGAGCNLQK